MSRTLGSWRLFWLLAFALSAGIALGIPFGHLRSSKQVESVILYSVRCSLPFFLVAFTASSLKSLWPNGFTRWLLANRRYFGLAFAFGMAWHLSFVAYYFLLFGNHLNVTALTLDVTGLAFLLLLTLTSFRLFARLLTTRQWRALHKTGVYAIWLLATYIYAESARGDRDIFHFAVLAILILAGALRFAAWTLDGHSSGNRRKRQGGSSAV